MTDPIRQYIEEPEALKMAADLDRIALHISATLYFASGAIKKAYSLADEKCIRHDDYDRLHEIAKALRGPTGQSAHELVKRHGDTVRAVLELAEREP